MCSYEDMGFENTHNKYNKRLSCSRDSTEVVAVDDDDCNLCRKLDPSFLTDGHYVCNGATVSESVCV